MIRGRVNGRLEAILSIPVFDFAGHSHPIDVIIDTGFTGEALAWPHLLEDADIDFKKARQRRLKLRRAFYLEGGRCLLAQPFEGVLLGDSGMQPHRPFRIL